MPWMVGPDGQRHDILPEHIEKATAAGYAHEGGTTTVINEITGLPMDVAVEDAPDVLSSRAESPEEFRSREDTARMERERGGVVEGGLTLLEAGAGAATGGLTDVVAGAIGGEDYKRERGERRQVHSELATAGDIGGLVLPALVSGGASLGARALAATPAGMIAKVGAKGGIKRLAAEGALTGVLQTGHEEALNSDPFSMERFASQLTSNVLLGAATGGVAGGVGHLAKAAGKGISKAKSLADDAAAKFGKASAVSDDLARLDMPGLKAAREAEQVASSARLADEVTGYHKASTDLDPILLAEGDTANSLIRAKGSRKALLKNQKALRRRPGDMLKHLEKEEQALSEIMATSDNLLAKFEAEDIKVLKELAKSESGLLKGRAARKYSQYSGKNITREGVEVSAKDMAGFKRALQGGELRGARAKALEGIPELMQRNAQAQEGLMGLMKGTSPELKAITEAMDVLKTGGRQKGFLEKAANTALTGVGIGATAPVLGFTAGGAVAKSGADMITDLIFGRAAKAGAAAGLRTSAALGKLMDVGAKVGSNAPPLASKVLLAASFGDPDPKAKPGKATLLSSYKRVNSEILSQVKRGPNGITMRPEARAKVAQRLSGVRAVSPRLADHIETVTNRKVSFLADKLPKRPDYLQSTVGPDTYRPSNMELRTFARFVAAVEDPGAVEERLADGTLSPEDAEAYRTVYPELYADMQRQIMEQLPELRATLPYAKRLSLSIFTGVAVDPSLDPRIFRQYQSQFDNEPGSEQGTQAPSPQPQFGSVKVPNPTPAQERAG